MARQVLPIVGAVVGAYFGGPQGAQIGYAIGSLVGNAVDPLVVKGPNIGDSRVQTSAEVIRPIYFGTACGAGNIIMAGPDIPRTVEHDQGKGGGPVTTENRILKTFAIGIGDGWKGPIVGISRIWENEKLVYDTRPDSTMVAESAKFAQQFTLYRGTETQMPDPNLEAIPAQFGGGAGNVSAFRGLAYIVFARKDITAWMSIPQYRFEVVTDGSATQPVQVVALRGTNVLGMQDWLSSADGIDFSGAWTAEPDLYGRNTFLLTTPQRYIAYNVNVVPAIWSIGDAAWSVALGDPNASTGGEKFGAVDDSGLNVVIPQNGNQFLVSQDGGLNWAMVNSSLLSIDSVGFLGGNFIGINLYSEIYSSVTLGSSWSLIENLFASFRRSDGGSRCYSPTKIIFGGHTASFPRKPAIAETIGGIHAWTVTELPGGNDSTYVASCVASQESAPTLPITYLAFSEDGKIWRKVGDGGLWAEVAETLPFEPKDSCHNGVRFYVIGDTGGEDRTGYIMSSVTGEAGTWEVERTASIPSTESWNLIQALAVTAGTVTGGPIQLDESVERIHELSGQSLAKVDTSGIAGRQLGGFVLAGDYSGQAALSMLASVFQFDSPEYDKQIHHRFRGQPIVRTITEDDLVDEPDEGLREDQIEFPRKLHLEAQNTASGYAPAKETSERESSDVRVVGELSVSAPVMFAGDAQAQAGDQARTANILHKVAWEKARGKREFVVPDKFLTDVPGDAYLVNIRGRSDRMTIDRQNYVDGVLRLEMSYDRASAYVSNRAGNTPSEQTPPPSTIVGATALMVLDLPAKVDAEDQSNALRTIAMGPTTEAWYGAEAQEQPPAGGEFARIGTRGRSGSVMGTLQADVAKASAHYTDATNRVRVQLDLASYSERVQGLTEAQFLSEGGAFALRNADGEVEVLQYMDVDDLGGGLIELSTLLRGRLNSGTFAFPATSRFVLLETTGVAATPSAYIGQTVTHRAVSYGDTAETATTDVIEIQGNSAKEWPVANVLLDRSGDTINVTIVPRHRFGTELNPIRSVNWTNYLVEFRDALDQVETVSSIAASLSFDASAMTFPIEVTVWQVNRFPWGTSEPVTEEIA